MVKKPFSHCALRCSHNVRVMAAGPDSAACAVVLLPRWLRKRPLLVVGEVLVDGVVEWFVAVLRHVDAD